MLKKLFVVTATAGLLLAGTAHAADAAPKPRAYANCTALNKVYPHGVGRSGAVDKTSSVRVTTFKRDTATYNKNTKSDRDKDGIACEKR